MSEKIYKLYHNGFNISYNEKDCFINEKPIMQQDPVKKNVEELVKDAVQKFYNSVLKKHYKNIVVLSAAGTSMDNGQKMGKSRKELWKECELEIKDIYKNCPKIKAKKLDNNFDIEGLLTAIILHEKVNEEIRNSKDESIKKLIEKKIADACQLDLDKSNAPHLEFLNKITARKPNDARVQLFTTNYDTLFEQASNEGGFIIIDGFSFTHPRKFSGRYFDIDIVNREKTRIKQEESFVSKVFHLYKLHGSLNWEKKGDEIFQNDNPSEPLVVYPASEKYESSYEQPYFEMMSRFQQSLRKESTLLIVVGFGFQDKHIQNVIKEAVNQNSSFTLVIVNYNQSNGIETTGLEDFFINIDEKEVKRNVSIVFDTFGGFTKKLPTNLTYSETLNGIDNEAI